MLDGSVIGNLFIAGVHVHQGVTVCSGGRRGVRGHGTWVSELCTNDEKRPGRDWLNLFMKVYGRWVRNKMIRSEVLSMKVRTGVFWS